MSLRSLVRRVLPAIATLALALPATEVEAQRITYRFGGTLSDIGAPFDIPFTVDFRGNAANVEDFTFGGGDASANFDVEGFLSSPLIGESIPLADIFPASFAVGVTRSAFPFSSFPADVPGVGFTSQDGFIGFYLQTNAVTSYDLRTSFAQVSGDAFLFFDGAAIPIGDGTFEALATVPEPSTYVLMATGLVGIVGFARRRKQAA